MSWAIHRQNGVKPMAVSQSRAAEVLAKCARHCCICRRYRPLHLQVHHIVEQGDGGTDDLLNLIAICVSCHSDVHTDTKLTRRFTEKELKLHRDNVCELVSLGKLPTSDDMPNQLAVLSASIVQALLHRGSQTSSPHLKLSTESVEILLAAVRANTPINVIRFDGGVAVLAGGQTFGGTCDLRSSAQYRYAISQLHSHHLVEGNAELLYVTRDGYLLTDDILAAGSVRLDAESDAAVDTGA